MAIAGSVISNLNPNQSIVPIGVYYGELSSCVYSKDNTPTLGYQNNTAGACGYLQGTVYNLNGNAISNTAFYLDFPFKTDSEGNYKASICSRDYTNTPIYYDSDNWYYYHSSFTPFNNNIEPEKSYQFDIYLLDSVLVDIPEKFSYSTFSKKKI